MAGSGTPQSQPPAGQQSQSPRPQPPVPPRPSAPQFPLRKPPMVVQLTKKEEQLRLEREAAEARAAAEAEIGRAHV